MSTSVSAEVTGQVGALTTLVRAMYPHASFPDGPYERAAEAIATQLGADARMRGLLAQGLTDLDAKGFEAMTDEDRLAYLHTISGSAFFQAVRAEVITTLYNDPEVWAILGWEGESFSRGGYAERSFDDLDWLPAARVEEASS